MKNLLILSLFLISAVAYSQEYNCYCPEPATYDTYTIPVQYTAPTTYTADPCNVVGYVTPTLVEPPVYAPTPVDVILVGSFSRLPNLKPGYLVRWDAPAGLFRVYPDHTRYNVIQAEHKAQKDGYCTYKRKTLPDNNIVGFYRT